MRRGTAAYSAYAQDVGSPDPDVLEDIVSERTYDSHTSLVTADDDNFFGKHSGSEPSAERTVHPFAKFGDIEIMNWETLWPR